MKQLLLSFLFLPIIATSQVCNPNGNVMIYSNYDGGVLDINVDVDIPNLIIGVVSYEGTTINLSGTFVNNVVGVYYAGYNASNNHCGSVINTSINGAPGAASTSIDIYPPVTLSNPNGANNMVCAYQCDNNSGQGGCNTVDQVEDYFISTYGGTLYAHQTQYGCWSAFSVSAGGNCCPSGGTTPPTADFNASATTICVGECVDFTDLSTNNPDTWAWTFTGAATASSSDQDPMNICYNGAGTFQVELVVSNSGGSDTYTMDITVNALPTVTLSPFTSVCDSDAPFNLTGGSPANGTYTGPGTTANVFDPIAAGVGTHTITYTFIDGNGCEGTANETITVNDCAGLHEAQRIAFELVPNPAKENFQIISETVIDQVVVLDMSGRVIKEFDAADSYTIPELTSGVYIVRVHANGRVQDQRLIKQ